MRVLTCVRVWYTKEKKIDLINFDPLQEKAFKKRRHWLLSDAHYLIVGSTGSSNTNLLLNMLTRWFEPRSLAIYTTSTKQGKYKMLAEFYATVDGERFAWAFVDVRVFCPLAQSNCSSLQGVYKKHEDEKQRAYEQRVEVVKLSTFTPLVFATSGVWVKRPLSSFAALLP